MITKDELCQRIRNACESVRSAEKELTEIDSHFGDADHGITMTKIMNALEGAVKNADSDIRSMLDEAATSVMSINGGSAVSLWNTWLDGLSQGAPEKKELSEEELNDMFKKGLSEMTDLSKARVGDKTMMDALIPATEALCSCDGSADEKMKAAAEAAEKGAANTRDMVSKFGRARSYGEATIGTPDAGAESTKYFFSGLSKKE